MNKRKISAIEFAEWLIDLTARIHVEGQLGDRSSVISNKNIRMLA